MSALGLMPEVPAPAGVRLVSVSEAADSILDHWHRAVKAVESSPVEQSYTDLGALPLQYKISFGRKPRTLRTNKVEA